LSALTPGFETETTPTIHSHQPPDYDCPLCHIAKGEATDRGRHEQTVILRDPVITAFIAGKWWRSNPGHVLIIPNQHIENIYDLPEDIGHRIFDVSKQVALALKQSYECDGVSTRQHNEPAGNQDVWHFHLHVFPRYDGDNLYLRHADTYWPELDEKMRYADKLKPFFT
jgi:histidine triad (HIT) family protein